MISICLRFVLSMVFCVSGVRLDCVLNITQLIVDKKYDKRNSPNKTGPSIIKLGIYINGFNYISEQSMDYEINIYMREQWWDPRLSYNRSLLCGGQFVRLPDRAWDQIWVPDVFFRNEKKANFHEVTLPNRMMRLYPNGTVYYAAKITAILSCQMDLHKYPLDTQQCPIQFESFGHTMATNIYEWFQPPVDREPQLILPQFELSDTMRRNCSQVYATGSYPCLEVIFVLSRNIGYYLIQLYIPSVLIVILSWVSFWISIDAIPARVTIGLLTVLTMTTQSGTARASLPRVSYIKAMDVWMSICLLFVFTSLLEFAVVNVFSRKEIRIGTTAAKTLTSAAKNLESIMCLQEDDLDEEYLTDQDGCQLLSDEPNVLIPSSSSGQQQSKDGMFLTSRESRRQRREQMRHRARVIDKLARKLFPLAFILFNVIYWIGYNLW